MNKFTSKLLLVLFAMSAIVLGSAFDSTIASAHSTTKFTNSGAKPSKLCSHQSVHLNGKNAPTVICLDQQAKGTHPYISVSGCNTATVTVWWDQSFLGDSICFSGNGFANLTSYAPAWYNVIGCHCTSWNDQASSFALSGCVLNGNPRANNPDFPGYFASDTNGNGQRQYFKWPVSKSWSDFTGQNGILPNDSLSSIYIDC